MTIAMKPEANDPPYKLASAQFRKGERSVLEIDGARVGDDNFALIAGPCTVESREQTLEIADVVAANGATMLRGGAYKPRTSPYSFQGLGQEGLRLLQEAKERTGLPIVTELMDVRDVEDVVEVADVIQVGARNMQNYALLTEIGRTDRAVLLKRGLSATLEELLMAAEYVLKEGNERVILCERGIRTHETAYRFTLDLLAVPALREMSHLPVIVDPSHAPGRRDWVKSMSLAAAAAGADGIIVEVHNEPEKAICDGPQALPTATFADYAEDLRRVAEIAGKEISAAALMRPVRDPAMSAAHIADVDRIRDHADRAGRAAGARPPTCSPSCRSRRPRPSWSCGAAPRPERSCAARTTACSSSSGRAASTTPRPRGEYARRARRSARRSCASDLLVVMRVYFEKPRTTTGWKGLINDPHLDGSGDVNTGLRMARELLLEVLGARAPGGLRVARPDHAAVHRRHRLLGGDRRAHHREPDPPPARLGPLDAGRLQERHRRRRPGRGRRGPRRRRAAFVHRDRPDGDAGDPAHLGERRRPRDPPRRPRRAQLRRRRRSPRPRRCSRAWAWRRG